MDLVRWNDRFLDPTRGLDRLRREINDLFDFSAPLEARGLFDRMVAPAVDVIETEDGFTVQVDLPGMDPKAIEISMASNVLTIQGEKRAPERKGEVYRSESWEGRFQRTISLPGDVDPNKVDATYKDGVLTVKIAKREEAKARQITVKAG
jgi:HSP20 family protein